MLRVGDHRQSLRRLLVHRRRCGGRQHLGGEGGDGPHHDQAHRRRPVADRAAAGGRWRAGGHRVRGCHHGPPGRSSGAAGQLAGRSRRSHRGRLVRVQRWAHRCSATERRLARHCHLRPPRRRHRAGRVIMPLVQVYMAKGRTDDQKRALLEGITKVMNETVGAPVPSIRVWITEFDDTEFIAGGEILADRRARQAAEQAAQQEAGGTS
ncbi:MAG TPA: hypothetical protein DCQ52_15450 [Acidimicrobiaceae bacterium]|nr:hypothetical protein [Acidimicrobiaceae bacterium]